MKLILALILVSAVLLGCSRGAIVFTISEVGDDVFVAGSGTINMEALFNPGPVIGGAGGVFPSFNRVLIGADAEPLILPMSGITRLAQFTTLSAPNRFADEHTGDTFGVDEFFVILPATYVSGDSLSGTVTFRDASLDSIGFVPGVYHTFWGTGGTSDFVTVNIVPELGFAAFAAIVSFLMLGFRRRKQKVEQDRAQEAPSALRVF